MVIFFHCTNMTILQSTTYALLSGIILSGSILTGLVVEYKKNYNDLDKTREIDIWGIITIIIVGLVYWILVSKLEIFGNCLSEEIATTWPHLAFRYGLGLGVFLPLLKLVPEKIAHTTENYHRKIEEYFPLLIISLILGSYSFMFIQYITINYGKCPSYIYPKVK